MIKPGSHSSKKNVYDTDKGSNALANEPHETLFRAIANFTYDWETWMGTDDNPKWINPAVERICGYTPGECLAMADYPLSIIHPDDRSTIAECLRQARAGQAGNDVEFKILHKTGEQRWGAVSWQTISDDEGNAIGYRTSVRDITVRKTTEQALRRAQQTAEKASADKSRFLASASHDLRQPIQAANMFAAALQNARRPDDREHIVSSLRDSLDATNELLDALLDVSRLDAGVTEPNIGIVHLADILEEIEVEFAEQAREKNLSLRVVASSLSVSSDPVLLLSVMRNLVSNAIRYTDDGRILVGVRRREKDVGIEVWDTGIGIDSGNVRAIFDDFRQLGNPERDRRKGLGLGLSIVRRTADLLGLKIDVKSEPGRGSRFSIVAPRSSAGSSNVVAAQMPYDEIDLSRRVALYIDDDALQLEAMRALLGQWDLRVICAVSAQDATGQLREAQIEPDVIIADFRLRDGETGVDAIRAVTRSQRTAVPAMILTGDTEPSRIAQATASGYSLLHKPVTPSVLRQTLYDLLH